MKYATHKIPRLLLDNLLRKTLSTSKELWRLCFRVFLYLEVYSCLDHIKMFSAGEHYNAGRGFYKNIYFSNLHKKKKIVYKHLFIWVVKSPKHSFFFFSMSPEKNSLKVTFRSY